MNQENDTSKHQLPRDDRGEDENAPAATSLSSSQEEPQARSVKKKKTTLIVAAAVAGLAVLGLVLGYFLWWQNPNKMVADAVFSAMTADKLKTSGTATIKTGEQTFTASLGSSYGDGATGLNASIDLNSDDDSTESVNFNVVAEPEGSTYFKADNLSAGFDAVIEAIMDQSSSEESGEYTAEELEMQRAFGVGMLRAIYEPIVKEVDGEWLSWSADTETGQESQCTLEAIQKLQTNKDWTKEIKKVYSDNYFLIVKEEVEAKNGSRGFVIDIASEEVEQKAKQFGEAFKQTSLGKQITECDPDAFDSSDDAEDSEDGEDEVTGTLTVWVDNFSHKLTSVELKAVDEEGGLDALVSLDFMIGEADTVEVPTDARDIDEVLNNLTSSMFGVDDVDQSESAIFEDYDFYEEFDDVQTGV